MLFVTNSMLFAGHSMAFAILRKRSAFVTTLSVSSATYRTSNSIEAAVKAKLSEAHKLRFAAPNVYSVTPTIVSVAEADFFAASTVAFAAENIAGVVPAMLLSPTINL
jgi:hypothetical protein